MTSGWRAPNSQQTRNKPKVGRTWWTNEDPMAVGIQWTYISPMAVGAQLIDDNPRTGTARSFQQSSTKT